MAKKGGGPYDIDDLENSGVWLFIQLYILEGGKVEKDLKHRIHS